MSQAQLSMEMTTPENCKLVRSPSIDYTDHLQAIRGDREFLDDMDDGDHDIGKLSMLGYCL